MAGSTLYKARALEPYETFQILNRELPEHERLEKISVQFRWPWEPALS